MKISHRNAPSPELRSSYLLPLERSAGAPDQSALTSIQKAHPSVALVFQHLRTGHVWFPRSDATAVWLPWDSSAPNIASPRRPALESPSARFKPSVVSKIKCFGVLAPMASRGRLAFFREPSRRDVVSSEGKAWALDGARVLERMNSLIVSPAKVARVLIWRCCSGSISMVSLLIPPKLPTGDFPPCSA